MTRHSFIQMSKLSNVKGRINYITSHARQENLYATYQTADSAFWSALAKDAQIEFKRSNVKGKCIEARELIIALPEEYTKFNPQQVLESFTDEFRKHYNVECISALHHNKRKQNGWLPKLFRSIVGKAKELLRDMIRTQQLPPKPVLSIDMDEYRVMQKLMIKVQDKAATIRRLQDVELPKLQAQLAETKGLFKGKERKALEQKIQQTEKIIAAKLDAIPTILQGDGYPDAEIFIAAFKKATEIVEQYRRDLSDWERKIKSNQAPDRQSPPPEKQSVRNRLRQLQAESKQRRTHHRHSQDRER